MIYIYRVTAGQERVVADVLYNKVKKDRLAIASIAVVDELRGYLLVESDDEVAVRQAGMRIPHIKGILKDSVGTKDIDSLFEAAPSKVSVKKGDIVELISGPFKGEKAKVIKIDESKEEITVELTDVAVPIPVTIKANTIKIYRKSEDL
ncbi:MAG: transcription elongation factor Spt5 [Candidatus Micrarchaeia archaeon]